MIIGNINVVLCQGLPLRTITLFINHQVLEWNALTGEVKLVQDLRMKE